MVGDLVQVEVRPDTETLHTAVSRDVWDDYYELPEPLVTRWEAARAKLTAAEEAITAYIDDHGLEPSYVDHGEDSPE